MKSHLNCPQCRSVVAWEGNPHRPFCSDRCRLIDLGRWANEEFRIPVGSDTARSGDSFLFESETDSNTDR